MSGNSGQGLSPDCRKKKGWSRIVKCQGKRNASPVLSKGMMLDFVFIADDSFWTAAAPETRSMVIMHFTILHSCYIYIYI
jgi:hypothetical protein